MLLKKRLAIGTAILAVFLPAPAIKGQTKLAYLFDLECRSATPGVEQPLKHLERSQSITVGKNSGSEIAYLYNMYVPEESGDILDNSEVPAEVVCILPSGFSQLNLGFGLDRRSKVADKEDIVLLEVYADEKLVGEKYVTQQENEQKWSVNIQNAQKLTIKADCIHPDWWNNCPRLSFTDMSLN
ncbi:hypothetical protein [Kamptonema formosum]|uniref:hypothetical protein n=1 Tax=Kamptonema formosum TaxID=331992 RepID=UPI000344EDD3|nr:hypothetical protein [Oscillatoria sp. PCC 10802]